jgi:predicted nucleic acid-binding protein
VVESTSWALPWSVVHEYLKVLTNARTGGSVPLETAIGSVDALLASPGVQTLAEPAGYWRMLRRVIAESNATGTRVFDARIAATCLAHGVSELWTADRHFGRFPGLRTRNPLIR